MCNINVLKGHPWPSLYQDFILKSIPFKAYSVLCVFDAIKNILGWGDVVRRSGPHPAAQLA